MLNREETASNNTFAKNIISNTQINVKLDWVTCVICVVRPNSPGTRLKMNVYVCIYISRVNTEQLSTEVSPGRGEGAEGSAAGRREGGVAQ